MTSYAHLAPPIVAIMANPPYQRIEHIRKDRWFDYPLARQALSILDDLYVPSGRRRRVGLLIVGPTNNGKTMIVEKFLRKHPTDNEPSKEAAEMPCVLVEAPSKPDLNAFYNSVLDYVGVPFRPSDTFSWKEIQVKMILRRLKTRLLFIDEIQHLAAGRRDHLLQFLNGIKNLSTALRIPIVALGTKPALRVLRSDPQIENRLPPFPLPPWKDNKDFRVLLNTFERHLPLKHPSHLSSDRLAHSILAKCDGDKKTESYGATIGEIVALLEEAAVQAINSGKEKIDEKGLEQLSYKAPSKRQELAERLL